MISTFYFAAFQLWQINMSLDSAQGHTFQKFPSCPNIPSKINKGANFQNRLCNDACLLTNLYGSVDSVLSSVCSSTRGNLNMTGSTEIPWVISILQMLLFPSFSSARYPEQSLQQYPWEAPRLPAPWVYGYDRWLPGEVPWHGSHGKPTGLQLLFGLSLQQSWRLWD